MTFQQTAAVVSAVIVAGVYLWPLLQRHDLRAIGKHAAAVAVLVGLFLAFRGQPSGPEVTRSPVEIALRNASDADKAKVREFYAAMADVVGRDDRYIQSVGKFRDIHAAALDLAFDKTELKGKYVGLDVAIDDTLVAAIGLDNVALAGEKKAALVKALKGIADAAR